MPWGIIDGESNDLTHVIATLNSIIRLCWWAQSSWAFQFMLEWLLQTFVKCMAKCENLHWHKHKLIIAQTSGGYNYSDQLMVSRPINNLYIIFWYCTFLKFNNMIFYVWWYPGVLDKTQLVSGSWWWDPWIGSQPNLSWVCRFGWDLMKGFN